MKDDSDIDIFNKESNSKVDLKKIEKDYRAIYKNMVVKDKGKVKKEINGKTLKCTEYQATILSEDIRTLFNDIVEYGGTSDFDTFDENEDVNPIQTDATDSSYLFNNEDAIIYNIHKDGNKE